VTVVDSDGIGGACVLFDCVPSKTFIASTGVRTELRRANGLGFDIAIDDAKISLGDIHNRVKTLARSQSADIGSQLLSQGVSVVRGRGELVDDVPGMAAHRVKVTTNDGKTGVLKADVVLIATGATPRVLPNARPESTRTPTVCSFARMSDDCALARLFTRMLTAGSDTVASSGATEMPRSLALRRSVRRPVEAMNVLDGTQSVNTHAPPIPSRSISVTSAPYWTATSAAS
jgi:pyruvate/2-oxoglutarate dehydrogenase complex dihydrolipoamide dehydrogenase (E3) component